MSGSATITTLSAGTRLSATVTLSADTTFSADRRTAVLAIAGDLDLRSAELLWPDLERLLDAPAAGAVSVDDHLDAVVLDATGLEFLDSSGLRVLLRGARLAEGGGTAFRLAAPNPAVRRVLELAGAERTLDVRPSLSEALA
jgi:anti-anti-sigma factor